ncbi:oxygen-independent coproporphyrinogen III oxidase [Thermaerobacter marianensis DSM 12885]|uniref:Heme chaperone HemW n=1 Tax=Thermaerobacter marianensis (strain ATCC 700841 / DSM 12885 / JCM 10246 / 7p75a) TaxID=644966 RepID=E6SKB0_THEM7|nr:radical SAM family heme chaperone HemW [Thermaerobacter marianensis]ADU52268.1 oxygen-independent coproporphyrinogen III oxidase [Thermaerobacter marianensis DSM 12885]
MKAPRAEARTGLGAGTNAAPAGPAARKAGGRPDGSTRDACGPAASWPEWDAGPALYVHVPYCRQRCYYCDFNTYLLDPEGKARYLAALQRELALLATDPGLTRPLVSVYVGGGTPSILEPAELERLLGAVHRHFCLAPDAEITVECNPGTLDEGRLAALRDGGVTRLSLGLQAVQDELLRAMGRDHTWADFCATYRRVRQAGFDNVNIDLIFGLPGQTLDQWEASLRAVVDLDPEHVSCYGLELHPGTPFHRWWEAGELVLPGEDAERAMFDLAYERLGAAGFVRYEISNFARPGRESVHNRVYWLNGSYLGAGPGAWSCWRGERRRNRLHPAAYAAELAEDRLPVDVREPVDRRRAMEETMILGLRLAEGVDEARFARRFGLTPAEAFPAAVARLLDEGWLVREGGRLRLSPGAVPVANSVLAYFVEPEE